MSTPSSTRTHNTSSAVNDQAAGTPTRLRRSRFGLSPLAIFIVCLVGALLLEIFLIKISSYSTSAFESATAQDANRPPDSSVRLHSLKWDLNYYSHAPSLAPLRAFYHRISPGKAGLSAVVCLSNELARRTPFGTPGADCFDSSYDPVRDFATALKGRPTYCVNRSSLIVTTLLSVGIPARLVQIPVMGHNILEVWDKERRSWIFFDPSSASVFAGPTLQPLSSQSIQSPDWQPWQARLRRYPPALAPKNAPTPDYLNNLMYANQDGSVQGLSVVYPEPWLYTRTGYHAAPFPFRATFVTVGPRLWQFGVEQSLLRWTTAATFLVLCALVVFTGYRSVRGRRGR